MIKNCNVDQIFHPSLCGTQYPNLFTFNLPVSILTSSRVGIFAAIMGILRGNAPCTSWLFMLIYKMPECSVHHHHRIKTLDFRVKNCFDLRVGNRDFRQKSRENTKKISEHRFLNDPQQISGVGRVL